MEMNARPRCNQSQITTIFLFVSMPMVETSETNGKSAQTKSSQVKSIFREVISRLQLDTFDLCACRVVFLFFFFLYEGRRGHVRPASWIILTDFDQIAHFTENDLFDIETPKHETRLNLYLRKIIFSYTLWVYRACHVIIFSLI